MAEAPSKAKKHNPTQKNVTIAMDAAPKVKEESMEVEVPSKGPNILAAEDYTHGGVRKAKFQPKLPTRRLKKAVSVKSEQGDRGKGELPSELMKLVKQSQEDAASRSARRADIRAPVRVAFGSGTSVAGRAAAGFQKGSGGGGGRSGGGGGSRRGGEKKHSKSLEGNLNDAMVLDDEKVDSQKGLSQAWDLSKYHPVTLPLRKPGSLDFDAEDQSGDFDENAVPTADELGLMQESEEDRYLFFQLPSFLPCSSRLGAGTSLKGAESSSGKPASIGLSRPDHSGSATWLEDLPSGQMGKLRVYSSGAVKLQLGDTTFEAVAGSQCVFAQELVGINSTNGTCSFLGDVTQRVILVPSLDDFLEKDSSEKQS